MIQRIQSIFLALVAIAMVSFLFVNIWQKSSADGSETVTLNCMKMLYLKNGKVIQESQTIVLAIGAIVIFLLSFASLFSFRNRLRQMQIGLANAVLIAALLGGIVYYSFQGENLIADGVKGSFGPGLLIPAISLILNSLANKFIRKDEEAVRASDRMR